MFSKTRLEALSDGLFAIVLTLLVLDIKVPSGVAHGQLGRELLKEIPAWFSFAFTFFLGSIFWVDQHKVLQTLSELSRRGLILNLLFLAMISVLPFSTSLWGHYIRDPLALIVYFSNQLAVALLLAVQLELAIRRGEIKPGADTWPIRYRLMAMTLIMTSAVVAAATLPVELYAFAPISASIIAKTIKRVWKKRRAAAAA